MPDELPEDDPAMREAMEKVEAANQKQIDEFDGLMEREKFQPITIEEFDAQSAAYATMSSSERKAWKLRLMFDKAYMLAAVFRAAATSDCDARPWQANSVDFYINAAMTITSLRYELVSESCLSDCQDMWIEQLKEKHAAKPPQPSKSCWPPQWVLGKQWTNN
jgi:hypothetical protein